jgi:hypothetical protein
MEVNELNAFTTIQDTIAYLRGLKPNDKSDKDRRYAIVLTDLEKAMAYYAYYVIGLEALYEG